jgi:hypothetical protein
MERRNAHSPFEKMRRQSLDPSFSGQKTSHEGGHIGVTSPVERIEN